MPSSSSLSVAGEGADVDGSPLGPLPGPQAELVEGVAAVTPAGGGSGQVAGVGVDGSPLPSSPGAVVPVTMAANVVAACMSRASVCIASCTTLTISVVYSSVRFVSLPAHG